MIVQDSNNLEEIGYDLWKMFMSFAIVNTIVFFLVIWSKYITILFLKLMLFNRLLITNQKDWRFLTIIKKLEKNLKMYNYYTGIQAEPLVAPSYAQVVQRKKRDDPAILKDVFMSSVKDLLKNNGYILLLISYGINVGAFFAISTLLNQFILLYYPVRKKNLTVENYFEWFVSIMNSAGSRRGRRSNRSHVSVVRTGRFDYLWIYFRQNTFLQVRRPST